MPVPSFRRAVVTAIAMVSGFLPCHVGATPPFSEALERTDSNCAIYVANTPNGSAGLSVDARSTTRRADGALVAQGDVDIREGQRRLRAARVEIKDDRLRLSGDVRIDETRLLLGAETASMHRRDSDKPSLEPDVLEDVRFAFPDSAAHGRARRLSAHGRSLRIEDGSLFFCMPSARAPNLAARHIALDADTRAGHARGVQLRLGSLPLLWLPIVPLNLGNHRHSGLLAPTLSASSDGVEWLQPLYLNLAPNYDLTLAGHYIEKRGASAQAEFRLLGRHSRWRIDATHLSDDRLAREDYLNGDAPRSALGGRWLYALRQDARLGRWRTRIDFAKVSDPEYERDFGPDIASGRPSYLNQRAELTWRSRRWDFDAEIGEYQPLREAEALYRQRPRLRLRRRVATALFQPDYLFDVEYADFERPDASTSTAFAGERLFAEVGLIWRGRWGPLTVEPWIAWRQLRQNLDAASDLEPRRRDNRARSFGLAVDAEFQRSLSLDDRPHHQILRAKMLYLNHDADADDRMADFDTALLEFTPQQPFQRTAFSGRDRLDDSHRLGLGVETEFIDDTGQTWLSASLGQIFHFRERQLPSGERDDVDSPLAAALRYRPNRHWSLDSEWVHDPIDNRLIGALVDFRHQSDAGWVSIGWRRARTETVDLEQPVDQMRLRFERSLGARWRAQGDWRRNLDSDTDIDAEFGLDYRGCCWSVSLSVSRGLDSEDERDKSVSLKFRLGDD